jgi:hypothetical protein
VNCDRLKNFLKKPFYVELLWHILDVYTKTTIEQKAEEAGKLARKVLQIPGKKTA